MSENLFDIPSRRYGKLARQRLVAKGYPEYDDNQARAADGTWGGGSGGASKPSGGGKPKGEGEGAFGRAVRAAGGVAAVAAILAASGVPGVRNVPGLRQLRNKVLGIRTNAARRRALQMPWTAGIVPVGRPGPHVRLQTEAIRQRTEPTALGRRLGLGEYKPSPAAMRRYRNQGLFAPFGTPRSLRER